MRLKSIVVALAGAALVVPATAAATEGGEAKAKAAAFAFSGKTSQNRGVALVIPNNLRRISQFAIQWRVGCESGGSFTQTTRVTNLRTVLQNNSVKFGIEGTYRIGGVAQGLNAEVTVQVTGKVRARTGNGSGILQVDGEIINAAGQVVDRCSTGSSPITWRVKLRR